MNLTLWFQIKIGSELLVLERVPLLPPVLIVATHIFQVFAAPLTALFDLLLSTYITQPTHSLVRSCFIDELRTAQIKGSDITIMGMGTTTLLPWTMTLNEDK